MPQEIQLFADKQIRTYWDDDKELYFFCVIDVVEALTDSNDPKQYIKRMRQRDPGLKGEGIDWIMRRTPPKEAQFA